MDEKPSSDVLSKKRYEKTLLLCKESLDDTFDNINEVIYEVYGDLVVDTKELSEDNYIFFRQTKLYCQRSKRNE